jgi:radical SAM protein with 4Fe4S-binding SPASM domain
MLNVTRLLAAPAAGPSGTGAAPARGVADGPSVPHVVVWNLTRRCNLSCRHCYASAAPRRDPDELTAGEGRALVDGLARAGVRSLVLSGGEPLLRPDAVPLAAHAACAGLAVALSTNGTLLDRRTARALRAAGVGYVGVSLDGLAPVHDEVRGRRGAWEAALRGLREARDAGLRCGVRFTLCRATVEHLDRVLDVAEAEAADRMYVSHLVHVGRARRLSPAALTPAEARRAVETIFDRAEAWGARRLPIEMVTGNNDADGVALYLRLRARDPARAERVRARLVARGGNATGRFIAGIDARGDVHPDQFWPQATLGSVRARPLADIWGDPAHPLLAALRARPRPVRGRCSACPFLELCDGGVRARAEALTGDAWAADPACHLTNAELGLGTEDTTDAALDARRGWSARAGAPGDCATVSVARG